MHISMPDNNSMNNAEKMVQHSIRLVSLPEIYLRVKHILSDEKASLEDVAAVVSRDPGLSARMLSVANSAFYGFASKVETVNRAINLLGGNKVHDLVLTTTVCRSFDNLSETVMNMDTFWQNSIYRAVLSHLLAKYYKQNNSESISVKGLLADIGHLVMYHNEPKLCEEALSTTRNTGTPLYLSEDRLLGCNYAHVGGLLLERLGLPGSIHCVVHDQINPGKTGERSMDASILGIAYQITDLADPDVSLSKRPFSIRWDDTGLEPIPNSVCTELGEEADKATQESLSLIYPGHSQAA